MQDDRLFFTAPVDTVTTMVTASQCDRAPSDEVLKMLAHRLAELDLADATPPPSEAALNVARRLIAEVAWDPTLPPPLLFLGRDGKLALEWQPAQLGGLRACALLSVSADGTRCEEYVSRVLGGRPNALLDRETGADESRAFLNTVRALIEGQI